MWGKVLKKDIDAESQELKPSSVSRIAVIAIGLFVGLLITASLIEEGRECQEA